MIRFSYFLILALILTCCSANDKELLESNSKNEETITRYWLDVKSRYPYGKIVSEKVKYSDSVKVSDMMTFDKNRFQSKLEETSLKYDSLPVLVEGTNLHLIDFIGNNSDNILYNIMDMDNWSGIVYSTKSGIIMRYGHIDYMYLLMETTCSSEGCFDNFYDDSYIKMDLLEGLPNH